MFVELCRHHDPLHVSDTFFKSFSEGLKYLRETVFSTGFEVKIWWTGGEGEGNAELLKILALLV